MNNTKRREIRKLASQLETIKELAEQLRDDEQEKLDNMPPSLAEGTAGEGMSEAIENLNSAVDSIEDAVSSLEEV